MITEHPLFMILLTLAIFRCGEIVYARSGNLPLLNPVILSITTLVTILICFDIPYETYKNGTNILYVMLAPAIIALAVPLYLNIKKAKSMLPVVIATVIISGIGIIVSAVLIGSLAGLADEMLLALTTKSVSAPIALEIAGLAGGQTSLTIIGVFSTGLIGVIIVPLLLNLLSVDDEATQGLILGITSHAFGITRALTISPLAAAFATMGMGLMGCYAVIVVPIFLELINL